MGFSRRTAWPRAENRLSQTTKSAQVGWGERWIDLTISNPTRVDLEYDEIRLRAALAERDLLEYAPSPLGTPRARTSVHDYYARRKLTVEPERVVIVASTSEAYAYLLHLLCDPGDEILVPSPSYPLFDYLARVTDVRPQRYSLGFDGDWYFDFDSMHRAYTDQTRALILVSPNNPTGTIPRPEDRRRLIDFASERGLAIISDEVFADFAVGRTHQEASMIGTRELVSFSLGGLSKSVGLPQVKAGWIVINGPPEPAAEARDRLEIIGDTFLSVSTPAALLLPAALETAEAWQAKLNERLSANRSKLRAAIRGSAVSLRPSDGGWSSILDLPELRTDEEWALGLASAEGVLVHPGYLFELSGRPSVVVSLLLPEDRFAEGLTRLLRHVQEACTGSS